MGLFSIFHILKMRKMCLRTVKMRKNTIAVRKIMHTRFLNFLFVRRVRHIISKHKLLLWYFVLKILSFETYVLDILVDKKNYNLIFCMIISIIITRHVINFFFKISIIYNQNQNSNKHLN